MTEHTFSKIVNIISQNENTPSACKTRISVLVIVLHLSIWYQVTRLQERIHETTLSIWIRSISYF